MIATLLALFITLYTAYSEVGIALISPGGAWESAWPLFLVGLGTFLFALASLLQIIAYIPLQRAEQNTGPQIFTLWRQNRIVKWAWLIWSATPFTVLACVVLSQLWEFPALTLVALPILGMAIDALLLFLVEVRTLLNPFGLIRLFSSQAKKAWSKGKDTQVLRWFDALEETGQRALTLSSVTLCRSTCRELYHLLEHFLERDVKLKITPEEGEPVDEKTMERARYIFSAFFQHLDALNDQALRTQSSFVCDEFIALFAKTAIILASKNIELATMPVTHLGNLATKALNSDNEELAIRASCALQAIAKTTPGMIEDTHTDLYPLTHAIIGFMQEVARERFRRNKETPLEELTRPFNELKLFFKDEALAARSDVEQIQESISRALEEFAALELVLYKLPIGGQKSEEEAVEESEEEEEEER